jgi:signal transduction histidine kinase
MDYLFDPGRFQFSWIDASYVIIGLLVLLMGMLVSFRERGTVIGRVYFLFTLFVSGWLFHIGLLMAAQDFSLAVNLVNLLVIFVCFIPAAIFHYTRVLIYKHREQRFQIQLVWFISGLFALLQFFDLSFAYAAKFEFGYYTRYSVTGYFFFLYFLVLASWTLISYFRESLKLQYNESTRKRLRLLQVAFLFALFAASDFLPSLGIDIQPFGVPFVFMLFSITTYVTLRYRLVDITADYAAENLLNIIHNPVIIFDMDGNIRLCNPAAEIIFDKQTFDKIQQEYFADLKGSVSQTKSPNSIIDHKHVFRHIDNYYEISISPIHSRRNDIHAITCMFTDISERIRYEEMLSKARDQLEQRVLERTTELQDEVYRHKATVAELQLAKEKALEASQAKSLFLSRMSHELRTPMNAILGFSQLLRSELDKMPEPEHKVYVEQIHSAGDHLLSLITDILDLSRIELDRIKLQMESVAVLNTLQECVHLVSHMADSKGITIQIDNSLCEGEFIYADKTRLKQVIINLFTNAVKYNKDEGELLIYCQSDEDNIRLCIKDSGIGIPEDMKDKVFIPFERLSNVPRYSDGAGIGLALCKHLIQLQGGKMGFESKEGEGSTFWLELPRALSNQADGLSPMV